MLRVAIDGAALGTKVDPADTASADETDLGGLDNTTRRLVATKVLHHVVDALQELNVTRARKGEKPVPQARIKAKKKERVLIEGEGSRTKTRQR